MWERLREIESSNIDDEKRERERERERDVEIETIV